MAEVWPESDDPTFAEAVHRSVLANLETIFEILAGRGDPDTVPEPALELAEVSARLDVQVGEIDKAYRVGLTSLWSRWFEVAMRALGRGRLADRGADQRSHARDPRVLGPRPGLRGGAALRDPLGAAHDPARPAPPDAQRDPRRHARHRHGRARPGARLPPGRLAPGAARPDGRRPRARGGDRGIARGRGRTRHARPAARGTLVARLAVPADRVRGEPAHAPAPGSRRDRPDRRGGRAG